MRWCEVNTLNFLKLYLSKECLWNPDHESYKRKFDREIAYSKIVSEFKTITGKCITVPEVKIKIKNLRATYIQEVQKIILKSSPDSIYKPSLVWFHDMDKCLKYVPNAKNVTAYSGGPNQADWSIQDINDDDSNIEECSDPSVPLIISNHEYVTVAEPCISRVQRKREQPSSPEYSNLYVKQKRKKLQKPQYCIKSQIENWIKEDEFDIYGKYIASQLRTLELQKALKVQFEIQNLINEARGSASED